MGILRKRVFFGVLGKSPSRADIRRASSNALGFAKAEYPHVSNWHLTTIKSNGRYSAAWKEEL